jgi:uncharacterized LabA/DUF88 family protein
MSSLSAARTAPVPRPQLHHPPTMAFVDANYLQRAACRALGLRPMQQRLDVKRVRNWLRDGPLGCTECGECQRVGWYDGAFDARHPRAEAQLRFLHAIGKLDLVQTRLGFLGEITPDWQTDVRSGLDACGVEIERFEEHCPLGPRLRQKGVDITLAIDLVRLADRDAIGHALLLIGDSDFAPAIEVAHNASVLITILTPERFGIAGKLRELADRTVEIPARDIAALLRPRPPRNPVIQTMPEADITSPEGETVSPAVRLPTRCLCRGDSRERPALHAVPDAPPAAQSTTPDTATGETSPSIAKLAIVTAASSVPEETPRPQPAAQRVICETLAVTASDQSRARYVPFIDRGIAGYTLHADGQRTDVYLYPSPADGDQQPTIVACVGDHGDPAHDRAVQFIRPLAANPCE